MGDPESYRILGVAPGASLAELKSAYRRLVKAYHPDSQGGSGNTRAFLAIVQAYRSLAEQNGKRDQANAASPAPHGAAPVRKPADGKRQPQGVRAGAAEARSRDYAARREPPVRQPLEPEAKRREPPVRQPLEPEAKRREPPVRQSPDLFSLGRAVLLARDPRERVAAARALAASGKKSSYAFLRKALWDRDERVLSAVVRAIADLDIRQSAGELGSLFSKATPALKKEILAAVARMGPLHGFESIARIGLMDADAGVRRQAAKMLGRRPAEGR